jgi:hypothetical protein
MIKEKIAELYIGSGKIDLRKLEKNSFNNNKTFFIIFLDRSYKQGNDFLNIEQDYSDWKLSENPEDQSKFCNLDIFEFMDSFKFKFNYIEANRIFEHMSYVSGEIGRLIEACNVLSTEDATLEIIVPNAISISEMLLDLEKKGSDFSHAEYLNRVLIINTELQNCSPDFHASTLTPRMSKVYIESEGTWNIDKIDEKVSFMNRDIYMKILCSKKRN